MSELGIFNSGRIIMNSPFASPVTAKYPKGGLKLPEASRGSINIDETLCTLCGLCERRCPAGAIETDVAGKEAKGGRMAKGATEGRLMIDRMRCISCGECTYECPHGALEMAAYYISPDTAVVIDVYKVQAVPGAEAVLHNVEMPPEEDAFPENLRKTMLRTREVQSIRRREAAEQLEKNQRSRAKYRNRRRNIGINKKS